MVNLEYKWLKWAKEMQAIAQAGLTFSKDVYDRERFEALRQMSVEIMQEYTGLEMKKIKDLFTNETGYQTPKVDVRGAVFRDDQILLVKEKADDRWALPGGFCDIEQSPTENIVKEIKEESGFEAVSKELIALLDTNKHAHPTLPYHYYKIFIHCEIIGGSKRSGIETSEVQFFQKNNLPALSTKRNTVAQINMLFDFLTSENWKTIID